MDNYLVLILIAIGSLLVTTVFFVCVLYIVTMLNKRIQRLEEHYDPTKYNAIKK